jgi:arylsulfatase A-like enzyme
MIAWWPGRIKPGTKTSHLSAFWDVLPTVADIAGIAPPKDIDGISFLPTLLNYAGQKEHDYLYWEFHEKKGRVAMRQGKWKAVRYNVSINPDSPLELYDLSSDPAERVNLAAKYPEVAAKMNKEIKHARTTSHSPKFNFPSNHKRSH